MLSWANESLIQDGRAQSDMRQGVTLEVMGEGHSMGPLTSAMKDELRARQAQIDYAIEWTTLGEYLEYLEQRGVSPNVASFIGAATVREHESGDDDRAARRRSCERDAGARARGDGRGRAGGGVRAHLRPGLLRPTEELIALAAPPREYGGMYISHLRSEGDRLLEAVEELITIAQRSGRPRRDLSPEGGRRAQLAQARRGHRQGRGRRARPASRSPPTCTPYTAGATGLNAAMPPWVQEGGFEAWCARLADPAVRARVSGR